MTLDPAAVERFRRDLLAACSGILPADRKFALAVSGGADSMAMLALAHAAFPGQVIAATFDHQLRDGSAGEAAMVAAHCAAIGVPHAILRPDRMIRGASVQAQARAARYLGLADWAVGQGVVALLTAHHADDQAETFLMRAARGSGIQGLAGIRASRDMVGAGGAQLRLLRPLLAWRSADLRALARASGTPFVDDPSNVDPRHDRTRFRQILAANPDLDVAGIAAAAAHAAEGERTLANLAACAWMRCATVEGGCVALSLAEVEERDQRRRLVRRAIGEVRRLAGITAPEWSDAANVESLLDSLGQGKSVTKAGVKASVHGAEWHFAPAPPRRSH